IPDFPYKNITIHHLLAHTSGLPDYMDLMNKYWNHHIYATNDDVLAMLGKYHPEVLFNPGEKFMYSNTGYVILSVLIKKISGMQYAEFLDKAIFSPLGMTRTRVYNTRRSEN